MRTSLFSFNLPAELIASEPPKTRGSCRLMLLSRAGDEAPVHLNMRDFVSQIPKGTVMVFNDTRVRKARVFARNVNDDRLGEFLFLQRSIDGDWDCIVNDARKKRVGQHWCFPGNVTGSITGTPAPDRRTVRVNPPIDECWFEAHGHVPLPPYIRRADNPLDVQRYQTVYARRIGSVAAPTAGLHFTQEILQELTSQGIEIAWLTLQVGLGTFSPVRSENVEDHSMHAERYLLPEATTRKVRDARESGRPVLAVGTTVVRALEASWNGKEPVAGEGSTNLFIYPGYQFRVVDQLFTNFHTPHSSLLMLVSAFCGRGRLLKAYNMAVDERYRFFSYGDAMLIR